MTEPADDTAPDRVRALTLTLSQPFVDTLDEQTLAAYVAALVAVSERAETEGEADVVSDLGERFSAIGVEVSEMERRIMAEQLRTADGHLTIALSDGTVLHGSQGDAAPDHEPDVRGDEDPASPHRPLYS